MSALGRGPYQLGGEAPHQFQFRAEAQIISLRAMPMLAWGRGPYQLGGEAPHQSQLEGRGPYQYQFGGETHIGINFGARPISVSVWGRGPHQY